MSVNLQHDSWPELDSDTQPQAAELPLRTRVSWLVGPHDGHTAGGQDAEALRKALQQRHADRLAVDPVAWRGGRSGQAQLRAVLTIDERLGQFVTVLHRAPHVLVGQGEAAGALVRAMQRDAAAHVCAGVVLIDLPFLALRLRPAYRWVWTATLLSLGLLALLLATGLLAAMVSQPLVLALLGPLLLMALWRAPSRIRRGLATAVAEAGRWIDRAQTDPAVHPNTLVLFTTGRGRTVKAALADLLRHGSGALLWAVTEPLRWMARLPSPWLTVLVPALVLGLAASALAALAMAADVLPLHGGWLLVALPALLAAALTLLSALMSWSSLALHGVFVWRAMPLLEATAEAVPRGKAQVLHVPWQRSSRVLLQTDASEPPLSTVYGGLHGPSAAPLSTFSNDDLVDSVAAWLHALGGR